MTQLLTELRINPKVMLALHLSSGGPEYPVELILRKLSGR